MSAETEEAAIANIKRGGLIPISVNRQSAMNKDVSLTFLQKKPSSRDLSVFCNQFVSIIDAGVPVVSALEMLSDQTENKVLQKAIAETKQSVEKGETLTSAMKAHAKVFSDMLVTLVAAGEASGSLSLSFSRMSKQFEKDTHVKSLMKKATIYPTAVLIVAVVVVICMLTFVIPTFEDMFTQLGTQLPLITRMVIGASAFLQDYWYICIAVVVAVAFGILKFKGTERGQEFFGTLGMKLPLFGKLTVKTACSRFCRTMSTLLASGLALPDALAITSDTMSNIHFKRAILDVRDGVVMGSGILEPLANARLFPPMVCHMVKIGEETGNLEGMLNKLADYYDEEVESATQALMAALEPMIIVVLAVIVGTIVLAIILPMATMYQGLDSM